MGVLGADVVVGVVEGGEVTGALDEIVLVSLPPLTPTQMLVFTVRPLQSDLSEGFHAFRSATVISLIMAIFSQSSFLTS